MAWSYRPAFDGVRCVAVYLVVLFHSGLAVAGGGFIGVDLFFVLSGFLITNVLLNDVAAHGRIRFGRFYARRVRRLLPAAVVVVAATCFAFLLIASVIQRLPLVRDAQSALLYVANWRFLHEQNDYFATGVEKSPFLHFWSLAIEEQFYVVFPVLLLLLSRAGRRLTWIPTAGIAVLLALSVAAQVHWAGTDPNHAYYGTDARAYQLLAGALPACALRTWHKRPPAIVARTAATVGLVGLLLLGSGVVTVGTSGRGLAAAVAGVLLIGGLATADSGITNELLSRRTPVYLGRVSYATYLWHWPVILVIRDLIAVTPVEVAALAGVVATALAAASYKILEMPIRRSVALDRFRWPTVAAGVSVCGLVAVALVPPVLESTRRPQLATVAQAAAPAAAPPVHVASTSHRKGQRARVPSGLDWQALANDYGPARTCDASAPQRCVVVHGRGLHIVLIGDSQGRMLAPMMIALAHEYGFTLSLNVVPSCPWQAQISNLHVSPQDQAKCTAARDTWYRDVLPKLHPDVAVLAEFSRDDVSVYGQVLKRTGGSNETLHQLVRDTTNETVDRITKAGTRVLILKNIITSSFDPLDCLARSTYLDQCAVPVPHPPISDSFYAAAAARSRQVFTFDLNPIICPGAPSCAPMIDGINVWRNFNHLSTRILIHFREQIWAAINKTGVLARLR